MNNPNITAGELSCDFSPLFRAIDEMAQKKTRVTVAIDGSSAAGKSTLAAMLKSKYSCNVFSMDDFFLRPFQKTTERLSETGGNVDYERFYNEVIKPLQTGEPFSYRPYNCRAQELFEAVFVMPNPINVVEGVYSLHPHFGGAYDIKVFLELGAEEQRRRLAKRNAELYDRFINEWIPMENIYLKDLLNRIKFDFRFITGGLS